ncbi:MAG: histidinol dehydrogenase, partial [candidate division NC10 bacterium]
MTCRRLDTRALGVPGVVGALQRSPGDVDPEIHGRVEAILSAVRARGDAALLEFTERFDGVRLQARELAVTAAEYDAAERTVGPDTVRALRYAADRIEAFHRHGLPRSWWVEDANGSRLGQQVRPLDRVGIYVPGARAAYPSTVLMTAVPARVAGVPEIVLVSPPAPDKSLNAAVLAAARVAGVTEAYRVGGAQAIAALAYGTETIRRVDKIVGPGNIYVALAKSKVFGQVGIDMVAGPSEVLVVADATADPQWIAADLLAQAEHDPMARAVLLTPAAGLLEGVAAALDTRLAGLERSAVAAKALENNGALVLTRDLDEAVAIANALAPEHL